MKEKIVKLLDSRNVRCHLTKISCVPLSTTLSGQFHAYIEQATTVSFSSCQWNLIKTFQIEAIIALITKKALVIS